MDIYVSHELVRVRVTVFRIRGAITDNAELEAAAQKAYDAGTRDILLDMSEVPYIATSGLRALHFIYSLLRTSAPAESDEAVKTGIRAGTYFSPHLKILNPSPHVMEALKVSGYDMFLQVYHDLRRALDSY